MQVNKLWRVYNVNALNQECRWTVQISKSFFCINLSDKAIALTELLYNFLVPDMQICFSVNYEESKIWKTINIIFFCSYQVSLEGRLIAS